MSFQLETARLWLRPWEAPDFDAFKPIATDTEVMRFINKGEPWPDENTRFFIQRQLDLFDQRGYCRWKLIEKETGRLIGFAGPGTLLWMPREVEIGWWIARDKWHQGFASEGAAAAFHHAMHVIRLPRLISVANEQNTHSIRIMHKLGMQFERWADHESGRHVVYYAEQAP
ncbi:MAG: GNAT family N-acetyltransferase [Bryobacteraceae bacterium]